MLFLHELKQLLVLVKQFSARFSQATTHMFQHFPIQLFANGGI